MLKNLLKKTSFFSFYQLIKEAYGPYKKKLLILFFVGLFGGFLEAVGVNAIIPVFSFVTGSNIYGSDFISKAINGFFNFFGLKYSLKYLLILICLLFIVRAIILLWATYIKMKISAEYEEDMRGKLFEKTLGANWEYLLKQKLGHLETVLLTNVQSGERMLANLCTVIISLSSLLMYIIVAVNISWLVTVFTLALGALIFVVFKPLVNKIKDIASATDDINRRSSHYINENVLGLKTIKSMNAEDSVTKAGRKYFRELRELKVRVNFMKAIPDSLMQPIGLIFIVIVFAFSYKAPGFNIAALAAVIYLIQRIFVYVQQIQNNLNVVGESVPYVRRVLQYGKEAVHDREIDEGTKPFKLHQALEFSRVRFSYGKTKTVLNDISFTIKQGEMIGLIGPSGSGKTTIVDLLLRLFNPVAGKITVDGEDIRHIKLSDWRNHIGYVSQDIFLTNETVADNIRFYDSSIGQKEMEEAAKMANIYDFVKSLPQGFNTVIGDRGLTLSAGQRQRIVIARILAHKPTLLILDEATSALDNESEEQIRYVIENLKGKLTVLIIAHRLSTIINTDKIMALENGVIVEEGEPQVLLENSSSYFSRVYNLKK